MTWEDWIAAHLRLHGYDATDGAEWDTLAHWAVIFSREGHTPEQLTQASESLVTAGAPRYRTGMLAALQRALERIRAAEKAERATRALEARPEPSCKLCGGSGWASVPRLDCLENGVWLPGRSEGTGAVYCKCPLGFWLRDRHDEGRRSLTLEEYELRNPLWREQLAERRGVLAARAGAAGAAALADEARGQIRALAGSTRMQKE